MSRGSGDQRLTRTRTVEGNRVQRHAFVGGLKDSLGINAFQEPLCGYFSSHPLRSSFPIDRSAQRQELNTQANVIDKASDFLF